MAFEIIDTFADTKLESMLDEVYDKNMEGVRAYLIPIAKVCPVEIRVSGHYYVRDVQASLRLDWSKAKPISTKKYIDLASKPPRDGLVAMMRADEFATAKALHAAYYKGLSPQYAEDALEANSKPKKPSKPRPGKKGC